MNIDLRERTEKSVPLVGRSCRDHRVSIKKTRPTDSRLRQSAKKAEQFMGALIITLPVRPVRKKRGFVLLRLANSKKRSYIMLKTGYPGFFVVPSFGIGICHEFRSFIGQQTASQGLDRINQGLMKYEQ